MYYVAAESFQHRSGDVFFAICRRDAKILDFAVRGLGEPRLEALEGLQPLIAVFLITLQKAGNSENFQVAQGD